MSILRYLADVISATFIQLFCLIGPFLVFVVLMTYVTKKSNVLGYSLMGRNTFVYLFKVVGTPIHEMGHVFFALIFRHKIKKVVLFDPRESSSYLGQVSHEYQKNNIYQNVGHFFIGIGPVLIGACILYALSYLVFGINVLDYNVSKLSINSMMDFFLLKQLSLEFFKNTVDYFALLFNGPNTSWFKLLIFFYIMFSVTSSMKPSSPDVQTTKFGLSFISGALLIFNLLTLWIGNFALRLFEMASNFFVPLYSLLLLCLVINVCFILTLSSLLTVKSMISGGN